MKLLDCVAEVARVRRLSANTCDAYLGWVRNFLAFCRDRHGVWRHAADLGTADVERFLNDLVTRRRLSASSQNQALCALVFMYRHVLDDLLPRNHLGAGAVAAGVGYTTSRVAGRVSTGGPLRTEVKC
jgi:site-specific recombinase XerD